MENQMADENLTSEVKVPKVFTFDVAFVLQVLAEDEAEAQKICEAQGGYVVSRTQTLRVE